MGRKAIYLNYAEALARIEQFMDDSGIRAYCETLCRGLCCQACYDSKKACRHHEGRRLACSYYLCIQLIPIVFPEKLLRDNYDILGRRLRSALADARRKDSKVKYYSNPYFEPYTEKQIESFRIRKSFIDAGLPTDTQCKAINERMHALEFLGNSIMNRVSREKKA